MPGMYSEETAYNLQQWQMERMLEIVRENLAQRGFNALIVKDREEARNAVLDEIGLEQTVSFGGSITLHQLGILTALEERGNKLITYINPPDKQSDTQARREGMNADVFLSSVNAISREGVIINIDGTGNRVASSIFGPRKVIFVAGYNKISGSLDEALRRARYSAVLNAKRLSVDIPCVKVGYCLDCRKGTRICRVVSMLEGKTHATDYRVILVPEALGL